MIRLLVLLLLVGCAPYPYVPYEGLDNAVRNAESDKERQFYTKRRDQIEKDAVKADEFFRNRLDCMEVSTSVVWHCSKRFNDREIDAATRTIDKKVRLYRRMKDSCGCIRREDLLRW